MVKPTTNSWRGKPRPEKSEKSYPNPLRPKSSRRTQSTTYGVNNNKDHRSFMLTEAILAYFAINLRPDKAGSSEKRFSAFSEAQGRPTAIRARIWNHDLNYFTSRQTQWRPQISTAGRGSSQQIEDASSQASGHGGVSVPPPTNQFRSV